MRSGYQHHLVWHQHLTRLPIMKPSRVSLSVRNTTIGALRIANNGVRMDVANEDGI
jgi:hypothetical protein